MRVEKAVLDTDILSQLMRRNSAVLANAQDYLDWDAPLAISIVTRYEILRGFKAKGIPSSAKIYVWFEQFCATSTILPVTEQVVMQAADIYADLYRRGELIPDADIFIAATALANGRGVVTNNERHFRRILTLSVENWLNP